MPLVSGIRAVARAAGGAALAALLACGSSSKPPSSLPAGPASPAVTVSAQPDGWEGLPASPLSPGQSRHEDLTFIDADNGWLVNARGEVHATHDGGVTWARLAVLACVPLRCVGFASLSKGWAGNLNATAGHIAPDAALWETVDGGASWTNISSRLTGATVVGLCGMRVPSPSLIVAVGPWNGPPGFVKSVDGGRSWTSRSMEPLVHGLVDVFFFNEREGFAVGAQGDGTSDTDQRTARAVVLATVDGGDTWEVRYVSAGTGQRSWKIQFVTDRIGFVTTEGPAAEGVV